MIKKIKNRNLNIDLIRAVAVLSVISVHFFMNINYYGQVFIGKRMYIYTLLRTLFMICVPLFLLLTGYLMNKKELTKKYYKGIIKVLAVYLIAAIACQIFKAFYLHYDITVKSAILSILNFDGAQYGWYIEMYIGLFMLIPFLNIMWNNIKTKKEKKWLIITLLILTVLPTLTNIFDWKTSGFFLNNTISTNYDKIVPAWWVNIYPLTYYFIGAYIKEYDIKMSKKKNLILFILCILIFGTYNFLRNYKSTFDYGIYSGWNGFENIISSTLIFIFLLHLDLSKINKLVEKIIIIVSELSLGTYLISYIVDAYIYPKILGLECIEGPIYLLEYFIPIILGIFIISCILSSYIYIIMKIVKYIYEKLKKQKE